MRMPISRVRSVTAASMMFMMPNPPTASAIKEVVILDPPKSHKEGPYFLNVLRVLDIPEALGLLAPDVRLTLINARDPAFDRVEQIYRLAGAADKLTRK
jgi:hypothetical protein